MAYEWDYFIAHAGADLAAAQELFDCLNGPAKVFLDAERLLYGDDWDAKLAQAQRNALVTLVLISAQTEQAYYEREEIAAAIAMARRDPNSHRVVPILMDESVTSPYGTTLKHGIRLSAGYGLPQAAADLLAQLPQIRALADSGPQAPTPDLPPAPSKIGLSVAVIDMSADEYDTANDDHTLAYDYTTASDRSTVVIRPDMDYLKRIAKGGPIDPIYFYWVPFAWGFPKLDFKVVNNTRETVLLSDVIFEIAESRLDPTPVLIVKPDRLQSNARHFRVDNEGWGPAAGMKAKFHLTPMPGKDPGLPRYDEPYPYEVDIGDLEEAANVDVSAAMKLAGVDLDRLERIGHISMRSGDTYTLVDDAGNERTLSEAALRQERRRCFGAFESGSALLSGCFEYTATTVEGTTEEHRVKFWTVVWIYNENRKGVPRPPSYTYSTKFRVDGKDYRKQVSISQEIKAGETDRFLVRIGFDKSSRHLFRARVRYNGGLEVISPPVDLLGFAPRSGIRYMKEPPADATKSDDA